MPREARKKSESNLYHAMLRGINRQVIFEEAGDYREFLKILKDCKKKSGFKLHAFCLMDNHVHMLVETVEEPLETIFKRIGTSYAAWYNTKYQRTGHLFQDRFRSEVVETDGYFLVAMRYIIQNPMKAGLEARPGRYRWSSYGAYVKGGGNLTDTQRAIDLLGSREAVLEYIQQGNEDEVMDEKPFEWRIQDPEAMKIMRRVSKCQSAAEFQQLDKTEKKDFAREMYLEKLSMSQIARLTGMPLATVSRAVKKLDTDELTRRQAIRLREAEDVMFEIEPDEVW